MVYTTLLEYNWTIRCYDILDLSTIQEVSQTINMMKEPIQQLTATCDTGLAHLLFSKEKSLTMFRNFCLRFYSGQITVVCSLMLIFKWLHIVYVVYQKYFPLRKCHNAIFWIWWLIVALCGALQVPLVEFSPGFNN